MIQGWRKKKQKNLDHFSICACHPCAGAMLIFSVSFQFYQMSPKRQKIKCAFRLYRPDNNFCKAYGLYTTTSSPSCPSLGGSSPQLFLDQFRTRFQHNSVGTFKHPVSLTFTPQNRGFHGLDFRGRWRIPATIFLFVEHQSFSFRFLTGSTACCIFPNDHSLPHLRQLRWVSHYTLSSDVFLVKPCFHWVATCELRLITLWNPPTSVMLCCFGGRFFVGAPSFLFSLVRSTIVVHFWSAHFFYFVDFLKKISLALTWLDLVGQWQQ